MRRIVTLLAAGAIAVAAGVVLASQNPLFSPSTGTVSGLALTNNFNSAIDSLNTCNSGVSAPTNQLSGVPALGNCWIDTSTSPNAVKRHDGNGHWVITGWIDPTNGVLIPVTGGGTATVSSATTTDIGASPQTLITISGTTTITSLGSSSPQAGVRKTLLFSGALTLTYNATSLILPGAASITTAAGDVADAVYLGGGNWRVLTYTRADGTAVANPAVPVGGGLPYFGGDVPTGYALAFGQTFDRTTFALLLTKLSSTQSVARTSGSPTLTGFTDTTQFGAGMAIEGTGIPGSTTILSTTSSTVTMSANASTSGTANAQVFYYGNGNGSTTFTGPNCAGNVLAGRDNMSGTPRGFLTSTFFGASPTALGGTGGAQSHTLLAAEMPAHNHTYTEPNGGLGHAHTIQWSGPTFTAGGSAGGVTNINSGGAFGGTSNNGTTGITINNTGGGGAHSIVPPALIVNCLMRVTP